MKFLWTTIHVTNLDQSIAFYENIVKLPLKSRFQADQHTEIAFLGEGDTQVELIQNDQIENITIGKDISLGFEVESVSGMKRFLEEEEHVNAEIEVIQPSDQMKFFFIEDPDGVKVQFVEKNK